MVCLIVISESALLFAGRPSIELLRPFSECFRKRLCAASITILRQSGRCRTDIAIVMMLHAIRPKSYMNERCDQRYQDEW